MSQVLGGFRLLDFTMVRPVLAWRAFWYLWTFYFFISKFFFGPRWTGGNWNRGYKISGYGGTTLSWKSIQWTGVVRYGQTDGQTDGSQRDRHPEITELIVAFRNFANRFKEYLWLKVCCAVCLFNKRIGIVHPKIVSLIWSGQLWWKYIYIFFLL
jgi:hypothetical protein